MAGLSDWTHILNVMGYIGRSFLEQWFSRLHVKPVKIVGKVQIPENHFSRFVIGEDAVRLWNLHFHKHCSRSIGHMRITQE